MKSLLYTLPVSWVSASTSPQANQILANWKTTVNSQTLQNDDPLATQILQGLMNLDEIDDTWAGYFLDSIDSIHAKNQALANGHFTKLRSLGSNSDKGLVPIPLQAIWGYGCWCYFGEDLMSGQGHPVNQLDGFCKNMQLCLRCSVIDAENCPDEETGMPKTCDPKTQTYQSEFSKVTDDKSILTDCESKNGDNLCAKNVCCCQLNFIKDLMSMITNMQPFDIIYQHARGWDFQSNCLANPNNPGNPGHPGPNPGNPGSPGQPGNGEGGDNSGRACCGQYPKRVLYNTQNLECCNVDHEIFNPMSHTCCADSGVKELGMC